jgi:hypothetical protein
MIFGTPVSGFEKKVKKLFRRRCWHFSNMRSLELKSLAAAKRPVGEGRDDICLVGSQSSMTDVSSPNGINRAALSWKPDENPMRPRAVYRWTLPSDRPANRVQKTEMSVQDWAWSEFLTHQGADL